MKQLRILFLSRAYPPVIGGIETQNFELSQQLSKTTQVETLANTHGKKALLFFLPYVLIRSLFLCPRCDVVLLGDGVMSIVGWILKRFFDKPIVCIVHGLDLTYPNRFYQILWVKKFLPAMDKLIAVGKETLRVAVSKGICETKVVFIPNGVDFEKFEGVYDRKMLCNIIGRDVGNQKFILTSGRLVKRKGVAWFIENVMPKLLPHICYIVAGDGPDKENIFRAVSKNNLNDRVMLLGYVSDNIRNTLLHVCDLFVQPNIRVQGDMEGFGISVIEAGICGIPVVASRLEGLKDAVCNKENGILAEPENADEFAEIIQDILSDSERQKAMGNRAKAYVSQHYAWSFIAKTYLEEIQKVVCQ